MTEIDPGTRRRVLDALRAQRINTPSWAYGNSSTRFKVFAQPGGPPDPGPESDHRHISGDAGKLRKLGGRGESAGVELVEAGELLGLERLIGGAERQQRRRQPFGQAGGAGVIADVVESVGHRSNSFTPPNLDALPASRYWR